MPNLLKAGILIFCLLLSFSLYASTDPELYDSTESAANEDPDEYETGDEVAPVEIGSAGKLRRETPRRSEIEADYSSHFHVMLESQYITEGRDNLDEDALLSLSTDITQGNFSFVPWLAHSASANYTELNLNFIYGFTFSSPFELYFSYTYLDFDTDGIQADDYELGIELAYNGFEPVQLVTSLVYSDEVSDAYGELLLRYDHSLSTSLNACIVASVGYNDGYVSEGHRGFDHGQLKACAIYFPWPQLEISGYLGFTRSIDKNASRYADDALLENHHWLGLAVSYRF